MDNWSKSLWETIREKGKYEILKDFIVPIVILLLGAIVTIYIHWSQQNLTEEIAKSADQTQLLQLLSIPSSLQEEINGIEKLCFYMKHIDKNSFHYKSAYDLLKIKSNSFAKKLQFRAWAESDSSMLVGNNYWVSYRSIVLDVFKKVYEIDPKIVKEALFNVFIFQITNMGIEKNINAGVLVVFSGLPSCSLSEEQLSYLKAVTEYPWSEQNRKYVINQYNNLTAKN